MHQILHKSAFGLAELVLETPDVPCPKKAAERRFWRPALTERFGPSNLRLALNLAQVGLASRSSSLRLLTCLVLEEAPKRRFWRYAFTERLGPSNLRLRVHQILHKSALGHSVLFIETFDVPCPEKGSKTPFPAPRVHRAFWAFEPTLACAPNPAQVGVWPGGARA